MAILTSKACAVAFMAAGVMKSTQPELLARIGLVLPWALDIAPILTPLAAPLLRLLPSVVSGRNLAS